MTSNVALERLVSEHVDGVALLNRSEKATQKTPDRLVLRYELYIFKM